MRRGVLTVISTVFLFLLATTLHATSFNKVDLAGKWRGSWLETTDTGGEYTITVDVVIDNEGNFTSGTWDSSGSQSGGVIGGSLLITPNGYITGTMEYQYLSYDLSIEVVHGQMDLEKKLVSLALKKTDGESGTGVLVKVESNSMDGSDLIGNWRIYQMESDPEDSYRSYWVNFFIILAQDNDTGSYIKSDPPRSLVPLVDIYRSVDYDGALRGSLIETTSGSPPFVLPAKHWSIEFGQVDKMANLCSVMTRHKVPNVSNKPVAAGVMIRSGSGFTTADMAGDWVVFHTQQDSSSGNEMYWVYSEITVDASGNVIKGSWTREVGTGTYSGGDFNLNDDGSFAGTLTVQGVLDFNMTGQVGISKNYGAGISISNNERYVDNLFFIRKPNGANNIPSMMLLLN